MGPQLSSRARTLRRACALLVLAIPATAGCRGIIGIEPLEIVDGGPDAQSGAVDGSTDGAGGGEAGGSDAGGGDASAYAACVQEGSSMCRPCCHMKFSSASMQLGQITMMAGCMCADGGACQTECASSFCSQMPPSTTCGPCFDNEALSPSTPSCMQAVSQCESSSSCHDIIDCMKACP